MGSVGRPLWSPASDFGDARTTGRDKPVPYGSFPPRMVKSPVLGLTKAYLPALT